MEAILGLKSNSITSKRFNTRDTYVEFDGYSDVALILCEVYTHIGEIKAKQFDKVVSDIIKMALVEKITGVNYSKIYAVCDEKIEKQLTGSSWKALALREFGVEVLRVNISQEMKSKIILAQKNQYR